MLLNFSLYDDIRDSLLDSFVENTPDLKIFNDQLRMINRVKFYLVKLVVKKCQGLPYYPEFLQLHEVSIPVRVSPVINKSSSQELKNVVTGLDLSIPSHVEKSGILTNTLLCNVVAVSSLACFKSPQHKEQDVVQFMVRKQLEDFENFRKELIAKFPGTNFPQLPKSVFSFVEGSTKQQLEQLEQFLKYVASFSKLATSVETIQFLGFSSLSARKLQKPKKENIFEEQRSDPVDNLFSEDDDEVDSEEDLFRPALISPIHSPQKTPATATKLFADQDYGGQVARGDDLVMVAGAVEHEEYQECHHYYADPEVDDLLNIDENLDALRISSKKSKKPEHNKSTTCDPHTGISKSAVSKPGVSKPGLPPKPGSSKPGLLPKPSKNKPASPTKKDPLFFDTQETDSIFAESSSETKMADQDGGLFDMDTNIGSETSLGADDIMRYIQDNAAKDDDLDLFS